MKSWLPVVIQNSLYFPPLNSSTWQTIAPETLSWDVTALKNLNTYLQSKDTKAFTILKMARLLQSSILAALQQIVYGIGHRRAGKTMTALLVGIALKEALLNINDILSKYLGSGWTSAPIDKENKITIHHQLTLTTGIDDGVPDNYCT